jgi:hypothetical protein
MRAIRSVKYPLALVKICSKTLSFPPANRVASGTMMRLFVDLLLKHAAGCLKLAAGRVCCCSGDPHQIGFHQALVCRQRDNALCYREGIFAQPDWQGRV